jgi:hypothetical protein
MNSVGVPRTSPEATPLSPLDLPERLTRVRAFVIAVLQDEIPGGRAADVINRLVDRLQGRLLILPCHVSRHGILRC